MQENVRIPVYLLVILLAATCLQEPWMIALQSAMGGVGLGYLLGRHTYNRT